ncbi:unnamed protein product, partial [Didymodactylos carnosus]
QNDQKGFTSDISQSNNNLMREVKNQDHKPSVDYPSKTQYSTSIPQNVDSDLWLKQQTTPIISQNSVSPTSTTFQHQTIRQQNTFIRTQSTERKNRPLIKTYSFNTINSQKNEKSEINQRPLEKLYEKKYDLISQEMTDDHHRKERHESSQTRQENSPFEKQEEKSKILSSHAKK